MTLSEFSRWKGAPRSTPQAHAPPNQLAFGGPGVEYPPITAPYGRMIIDKWEGGGGGVGGVGRRGQRAGQNRHKLGNM